MEIKKIDNFTIGIIAALIAIVLFAGALTVSAHGKDKTALCHETESESNPWVVQEVNANEIQSHLDNGDKLYQGSFDIHSQEAKDWCAGTTPTPTSEPTITLTETPTVNPCQEGIEFDTESPCVTPEASPSAEVTPSLTPAPTAGESAHGDGLSDGRSDGKSDGRSSAPQVTLTPCTVSNCGWK